MKKQRIIIKAAINAALLYFVIIYFVRDIFAIAYSLPSGNKIRPISVLWRLRKFPPLLCLECIGIYRISTFPMYCNILTLLLSMLSTAKLPNIVLYVII